MNDVKSFTTGPNSSSYLNYLTPSNANFNNPRSVFASNARSIALVAKFASEVSKEQRPPRWGGYASQKLCYGPGDCRALAQLESEAQHGSAAKADFVLERSCPTKEHGSGTGDCVDGGGVVLKRIMARPRWRD